MPTLAAAMARLMLRSLPLYNGKGRLVDRTGLNRISFPETVLDIATADGFRMFVMPNDLIGRHLYLTGRFDRCVVDALVARANPGAVLWDVGANLGYVSCAFLHRVPDSRVLAIEPLPDVADLLRRNLERVGGARARVVQAAISDHDGEASFTRTPGNLGKSHVNKATSEPGERIRLATPSSLLALSDGRVDVVKIDVEGHELAVLAGLAPVLRTTRPSAVIFEHHTLDGVDPAIACIFDDAGYDVHRIHRRWNGWKLGPCTGRLPGYAPSSDFVATCGHERVYDVHTTRRSHVTA